MLKVIGNRSHQFLEQRQKDLEKYLQKVLFFLQHRMCREFIEFLELNKYDIVYLLQDLANIFFQQSELLLQFFNKRYEFSVLELHAISERLRLPCPPNETIENIYDFTHVVDFCSQIERLTVKPRNVSFAQFRQIKMFSNPIKFSWILIEANHRVGSILCGSEFGHRYEQYHSEQFEIRFSRVQNSKNIANLWLERHEHYKYGNIATNYSTIGLA